MEGRSMLRPYHPFHSWFFHSSFWPLLVG